MGKSLTLEELMRRVEKYTLLWIHHILEEILVNIVILYRYIYKIYL